MKLSDLYKFESNTTVRTIMKEYFFGDQNYSDDELINFMINENDDCVWSWCEESGMKRVNFIDWVEASLDETAKFKVLTDNGNSGCAPETELNLDGGVIFTMIWGNIED